MNNRLKQLLYVNIFALFFISQSYAAIVAGGMVSTAHHWDTVPSNGFNSIEVPVLVSDEPRNSGYTFWINQFFFKNGDGGNIGFQQRADREKYLNFSIWKTSGWKTGYPAYCRSFSHEGSGVQCDIPYEWKEGEKYVLKITKNADDTASAYVTDIKQKRTQEIARISLPREWGGLISMSSAVETFYQTPGYQSCASVPATTSVTYLAVANQTIKAKSQTTSTYGNCAQVAQSYCSNDGICIATINHKNYTNQAAFNIKNTASGYCADSLNGGNVMGLYPCSINNGNQKLSTDPSHRLYLTNRDACLTVNSSNTVAVDRCNNDSTQRWLYLPNTKQFMNAKSNLCMDAAEGGKMLANVQVYSCLSNNYQQWTPSR